MPGETAGPGPEQTTNTIEGITGVSEDNPREAAAAAVEANQEGRQAVQEAVAEDPDARAMANPAIQNDLSWEKEAAQAEKNAQAEVDAVNQPAETNDGKGADVIQLPVNRTNAPEGGQNRDIA